MPLRFLNPNYHVILIHYPLGVFMLGVVLELMGFLWKQSSLRVASKWMILLGGLASLPAATSGIFALSQVSRFQVNDWTPAREHFLRMHTWLQSSASLLAVLTVVFGLGASNHMRRAAEVPLMICLLLCAGGMVAGSWFGGETVYTQQTAVQTPKPAGESADSATTRSAGVSKSEKGHNFVPYYTGDPIQIHMIMAGVAFAFALGSLGLSVRKITSLYPEFPSTLLVTEHPIADDSTDTIPVVPAVSVEHEVPLAAPAETMTVPEIVYAGRFWIFAALLALATAVGGYWVWAIGNDGNWSFNDFWDQIMAGGHGSLEWTRASLHVWIGLGLILVSFILAALSRWTSQNKPLLAIFALLLVCIIAAQTWLGVVLQFEGADGPIYRWSPETPKAAVMQLDHKSA